MGNAIDVIFQLGCVDGKHGVGFDAISLHAFGKYYAGTLHRSPTFKLGTQIRVSIKSTAKIIPFVVVCGLWCTLS